MDYPKIRVAGKMVRAHRIIAGAAPGEFVDHVNGDKRDNRPENLRVCTRAQNNQNRRARRDSKAPYKGITKPKKGRWVAQIMVDKKYIRIGAFDTPEEAARAYDEAAVRYHGPFAKTNGFVTYGGAG